MKHKNILKIALFFLLMSNIGYGQIYQHDFGTTAISGKPYTVAPGTLDANLSNSSWTTSATEFTSFAGSSGQALSLSNSSGTPTITLTFDVTSGFKASFTQFSFWRRRSNTGAQNWSITINDIVVGNGTVPSTGSDTGSLNVANAVDDLTGTVTVVISLSGASGTGTFRLDDFTLIGSVTSIGGAATPGITLGTVSGNTTEAGGTATFTAVLNAQPTSDVVLNVSSADTGEVTVAPATLTFTNGNWDTPQTVTATGVDDAILDGNQDVTITVSVNVGSSDAAYSAVADVTRTVTNEDDEVVPGITLTAATNNTNESGTTATFTAVLDSQPTSSVVLNISSADTSEVTVSPATLTFTTSNWNTPQTVTLTGVDDALTDGNQVVTITVTGDNANGDANYNAVLTSSITVTNEDNDVAPNFENFNNSNATASYSNNSFVGNNGITWTYVESRNENGDANASGIDGKALMLRYNAPTLSKITSSAITGGIQNFSVKLYKGFTGAGGRQVELFINNVSKGTSVAFDDYAEHTFTVNDINVSGDVIIEIRNITDKQVIIDDISWTGFTPATATWTGNTNTDWATASNWDTNAVPTAIVNAVIPDVANAPIIGASTNAAVYDLTITESEGLVINSGGSLIVNGTSTGSVTYKRTLGFTAGNLNGWYLVSSPVAGQAYNDTYASTNGLATSGTKRGLATYNSADNTWSYLENNDSNAGTFMAGKGYSVKRETNSGDISFTGTINANDVPFTTVTGFNLVGNPFTSFLDATQFINGNSANIAGNQIWVWDQGTGNYNVKNLVTTIELAPAQGFFVNATSPASINMSKTYQKSTGNAFQKSEKTEVHLSMTDGTNNRFAKVYYLDNASTGFDNGYDGETFGGITNTTDVFTHLVANSEGKKYQVQSLPNSDFDNMVIPVGIISAAGKEITFTAEAMNLPEGLKVFLEDRVANTMTRLDETNSSYKVTLSEDTNGIGRFYLHTKASGVLSTANVSLENVSVYSIGKNELRVVGLSEGKASLKLYNILGKQVFANSFNSNGVQVLSLPTLATGIYIVQLETEKGNLNKKITLE